MEVSPHFSPWPCVWPQGFQVSFIKLASRVPQKTSTPSSLDGCYCDLFASSPEGENPILGYINNVINILFVSEKL